MDGMTAAKDVITKLYDDADLIKTNPYLPTLKQSILKAVPRPVTPFYPAVTQAIQVNAFQARSGATDVDTALENRRAASKSAAHSRARIIYSRPRRVL